MPASALLKGGVGWSVPSADIQKLTKPMRRKENSETHVILFKRYIGIVSSLKDHKISLSIRQYQLHSIPLKTIAINFVLPSQQLQCSRDGDSANAN